MSRNGPIAREAILVDGNDQRFFEKALSDPRSLWIRFSNRRIYRIFSPSRACDGRPFRPARISGGERHRKYLTSSTHSSQTCQVFGGTGARSKAGLKGVDRRCGSSRSGEAGRINPGRRAISLHAIKRKPACTFVRVSSAIATRFRPATAKDR